MKSKWVKNVPFEITFAVIYLVLLPVFVATINIVGPKHDPTMDEIKTMQQQVQRIERQNYEMIRVIQEMQKFQTKPEPVSITLPVQTTAVVGRTVVGGASTYTEKGCLGCDVNRIMANGEKLDDDRRTLALACRTENGRCKLAFGLNTSVKVTNSATGKSTVAKVTDTFGGIYGRVADLSLATAQAVGCSGTPCPVIISK